MFYGNYGEALKDLKAVVESGSYELVDDYEKLFNSATEGYMSKESVFITLRSYIPSYTGGSVCPQMNVGRGIAGGWGGECPTKDLVDEYEVGDPRLVHTYCHPAIYSSRTMVPKRYTTIPATTISHSNTAASSIQTSPDGH